MNNIDTMNRKMQAVSNDVGSLADDARALISATADVAGDKVVEARQRLTAALERGQHAYVRARGKAVEGAHAANETIHEHPYQAIAIGAGIGALLGFLLARRGGRNGVSEET